MPHGTRKLEWSPWGWTHDVEEIETHGAGRVAFYSTASHGGFRLDARANGFVPESWKAGAFYKPTADGGGWYEEDCEAVKVILAFPGSFPADVVMRAEEAFPAMFPGLDASARPAGPRDPRPDSYQPRA